MNKEEIQDILEELHLVRPEILQPKAKKLFEAIMSIADERDELQQRNSKAIEYIKDTFDYREEENIFYNADDGYEDELKIILEILKGSDKE